MEMFHISDIISILGLPYPALGQTSYYIPCPCCDKEPHKKHLNINVKKDVFRCPRCGVSSLFLLYIKRLFIVIYFPFPYNHV